MTGPTPIGGTCPNGQSICLFSNPLLCGCFGLAGGENSDESAPAPAPDVDAASDSPTDTTPE
jgi:hypothetical protein